MVEAARAERLLTSTEESALTAAAAERAADPGYLDPHGGTDLRLAALAATIALRRHARESKDLGGVRLFVGSGGVLRHGSEKRALGVLDDALRDHDGGWALPRGATTMIDSSYVLAAAGLLAAEHPAAADALLRRHLRAG